jgi:uncharacterized protein (TIGR00251 family)
MTAFDEYRKKLQAEGSVTIELRVRPNAKQTRVTATMDDGSVKVELAALAEGGKANEALVHFLSESLGVPSSCVELLRGHGSRRKIVRISLGARFER